MYAAIIQIHNVTNQNQYKAFKERKKISVANQWNDDDSWMNEMK